MTVTRVLVLGVLHKQPMHGYEVRRELESWNAEQWANITYGSIYFSLAKMAEEHLVEVVSTDDRGTRPARTVYAITCSGRNEFVRLLRELWWEYRPVIDPFRVALSFMNCLPRDEVSAALHNRAFRFALDPPGVSLRDRRPAARSVRAESPGGGLAPCRGAHGDPVAMD